MAQTLAGFVERVAPTRVAGWVWNESDPSARLRVAVRHRGATLIEVDARRPRADLLAAGIGDGAYSFDAVLEEPLPEAALREITVEVAEAGYRIPFLPSALEDHAALKDCQLNVYNVRQMRALPPAVFGHIRFDPNNDCNLRCVYCHNPRTDTVVSSQEFRAFLHENVVGTHFFQVGCAMEPTLDARLADLLLMVGASPAKPKIEFQLQTNGILLHRHDLAKIADSGLTALSVSVDAAEPSTQKLLRSGTSLDKVVRNVVAFTKACPRARLEFICTVTKANLDKLEGLVSLGLDVGVARFVFREVFYRPDSEIVDHARMPELVLSPGDFKGMQARLLARFGGGIDLVFADRTRLDQLTEKMWADSNMP